MSAHAWRDNKMGANVGNIACRWIAMAVAAAKPKVRNFFIIPNLLLSKKALLIEKRKRSPSSKIDAE